MIDFRVSLYSQNYTKESLLRTIDSLLGAEQGLQARMFPVYIAPSLWQSIRENGLPFQLPSSGTDLEIGRDFRLISASKDVSLFDFSFDFSEKGQKNSTSGKLFVISSEEYPDVFTVLTIENGHFFSLGILPYFKKLYPRATLTFITHKKLQNLLINFRDNNEMKDFTIVRTTNYSRMGKKIVPSVNWPEFSLEKAFEWVADENGWFQNLAIKARKQLGPTASLAVSRKGVVRTNGYLELIYRDILAPISHVVRRNVEFFGKRARLDSPERSIHPLCINLGIDKFTELEENKTFVDAMGTMKAISLSVLHANPYVHLSLFDYYDGSSFNIWVLSTDKIIIVPQLKASFQSVKRLINHIFDSYCEGNIEDFEVAAV